MALLLPLAVIRRFSNSPRMTRRQRDLELILVFFKGLKAQHFVLLFGILKTENSVFYFYNAIFKPINKDNHHYAITPQLPFRL